VKLARVLLIFIVLAVAFAISAPVCAGLLPSEVLVVYNRQQQYSENVAKYYAYVRGIPEKNLCGIDVWTQEAIYGPDTSRLYSELIDQIEQYLLDNFNPNPSDPEYYKANPPIDPIKAIVRRCQFIVEISVDLFPQLNMYGLIYSARTNVFNRTH
jgi:hypothetical protein